jgi:hypothetical protein
MFGAVGFAMGLLFVAFGMGGIENSVTWEDWRFSLLFCAVGLIMMWVSVDVMKEGSK